MGQVAGTGLPPQFQCCIFDEHKNINHDTDVCAVGERVMKRNYKTIIFSLVAGVFWMALSSCTALKTFPQAARAGDTVSLALGSADGMSRANTTAAFFPDADPSTPYDITSGIRGIFRLYADKASSIYTTGSNAKYIVTTSGHEPWVTVMVVDLPPGLPVGPGKVHITTPASYPTIGSDINDLPVSLEILPGTGVTSDLSYEFGAGGTGLTGDLTLLESQPLAQIVPLFPSTTSWPTYGAIELHLSAPTTLGTVTRVVSDDFRTVTPTSTSTVSSRDSNQDTTVILLNPTGRLRYYSPRFSLVIVDPDDTGGTFASTPVINSVQYFDANGNPVAGPPVSDYSVQIR